MLAWGATPEMGRSSVVVGAVMVASVTLPPAVLAVWLPCPSSSSPLLPSSVKSQAPMSLSLHRWMLG